MKWTETQLNLTRATKQMKVADIAACILLLAAEYFLKWEGLFNIDSVLIDDLKKMKELCIIHKQQKKYNLMKQVFMRMYFAKPCTE